MRKSNDENTHQETHSREVNARLNTQTDLVIIDIRERGGVHRWASPGRDKPPKRIFGVAD